MYQLLLCLRYLRTRYLAFVCIVSVMLGVATLIVVNSVMSGFSNKLKDRLHGILADVVIETELADGFEDAPDRLAARVTGSPVGQYVEAVSPTVEVFALLQFHVRNKEGKSFPITKHVKLVGVDPTRHAAVGKFREYLVSQRNSPTPTFDLTPAAKERFERNRVFAEWGMDDPRPAPAVAGDPGKFLEMPPPGPAATQPAVLPPPTLPVPPPPRVPGMILGYGICHFRYGTDPQTGQPNEVTLLRPGDDVFLATVAGASLKPVSGTFAVADFFKSEMSEYDSSFVYVPLDDLQRMRGMGGRVNVLQLKLKPGVAEDARLLNDVVVPGIQSLFAPGEAQVRSWQQHQGPLLDAIDVERRILNILLFMIVGVAGFGVLAIFSMIVTEKYRDIGVLKSLGASDRGVMGVFLGYGLLLGLVGCGLGSAAGLLITKYLNQIEQGLAWATGQQVFDRKIYYFDQIPTNVDPLTVALVNVGAVAIAVGFSVLPALKAARLHPVRALRFE